jgi:anti-sigma28 factor (negative regulator of flagellin synthesis)
VKIHNNNDLFLPPTNKSTTPKTTSPSTSTPALSAQDELSASSSTSNIGSTLTNLSSSRATRISQLANQYASGNYTVDSAKVAQSLVFGAFSISS